MVKSLPAMQETQVQSLGQEDTLEKGMATHSNILAWRGPWQATDHGVTNSWTWLRDWQTYTHKMWSSWWRGVCGQRLSPEFTTWVSPVTIRSSFWCLPLLLLLLSRFSRWLPRQEVFAGHSLTLSWDIQKDPRRCKISAQDHGQLPHPHLPRVCWAA